MSAICPHCGRPVELVPGSNRGSNPGSNDGSSQGSNGEMNIGLDLDLEPPQELEPSPKSKSRTQGYNVHFLEFWVIYPRHQSKGKAQKAWLNAVHRLVQSGVQNAGVARVQIMAGAARLRDDPNRLPEFTPLAASWLNADGWEDEPLPARIDRSRRPDPPRPLTSGEMDRAIEEALRDA